MFPFHWVYIPSILRGGVSCIFFKHIRMATSEGKPAFDNNSSRLPAHAEEEEEEGNLREYQDPVYGEGDGCGCFRLFRFDSCWGHDNNEDRHLLRDRGNRTNTWWATKLKKAKEFSEVVAGPKWKNFIRKLGGHFNDKKKNRFRYDADSYALNFDQGDFDTQEEDGLLPPFSSRFPPHFPPQQSRPG